jgi:hypothetical protein
MWHNGTGRLKIFNRWALLDCGREISKYYCSLYNSEFFYRPKLQQPLWGGHISIIRGETLLDSSLAEQLIDIEISYRYQTCMSSNGCHFYLPVLCPTLDSVREAFGLGPSLVAYHLSIGNLRNDTSTSL